MMMLELYVKVHVYNFNPLCIQLIKVIQYYKLYFTVCDALSNPANGGVITDGTELVTQLHTTVIMDMT